MERASFIFIIAVVTIAAYAPFYARGQYRRAIIGAYVAGSSTASVLITMVLGFHLWGSAVLLGVVIASWAAVAWITRRIRAFAN